ncbi:MAG: right-handed parallel beta-helix repeat-containing protein [Verrucomicrobia bacterium]|nr:right-handed parallel beta-helix repeat-containing protein [Verrucomicrobiota bacterium]
MKRSLQPWLLRSTLLLLSMLSRPCFAADVETTLVSSDWNGTPGAVIRSRLVVRASHIVIDGRGATLQGPGDPGDIQSMEAAGVGILLDGCVDVTVRNLKARGFAVGIRARDSQALLFESCDASDNYHNPKHGWGELPPRGGFLLERTRGSVIRQCRANQVWDALHLVDSDDNLIEDNDCSRCSNTCGKLWRSSRNRFLRNNFSYGIRIDRAAGEVHARDSTSVLIETGSDDNYWFRNDMTQGGDGLFIRVLNGWVSRGNVFVENDTSFANNNCVESWSPGNTYLRNKANHGSYGFWLGGSDQTTLIGNEAAHNGLTNGNHNAPEPGFGHGGIVVVGGSSSHTRIEGNYCHHNNGGGIVFRGDAGSRGKRWQTRHWIVQQNRLEENRWGIWGQWGDEIWVANNRFSGNASDTLFESVTRLTRPAPVAEAHRAPLAALHGPSRAVVGQPVRFDASASLAFSERPLRFHWTAGDLEWRQPAVEHVFSQPGFYRLGVTVDDGALADLAWRDLIVTEPVVESLGTEGQSALWGFELEGNSDGRGRMRFSDDTDAVVGKTSLRFTPNPYPGLYATAVFPGKRDADFDLSAKAALRFWIRTANPNLPGFQNAGPVIWLYTADGSVKLAPAKEGNLFIDLPFSEARWSWMSVRVPLAGDAAWSREARGGVDLKHVRALGIALDSWGGDPFTVWLDGLAAE